MEIYYAYILKSRKDGSYYKGLTTNPTKRLFEHNNGLSKYTSTKMPWDLVYVELMDSYLAACKRERSLKQASVIRIEEVIGHSKNIVSSFISGG